MYFLINVLRNIKSDLFYIMSYIVLCIQTLFGNSIYSDVSDTVKTVNTGMEFRRRSFYDFDLSKKNQKRMWI